MHDSVELAQASKPSAITTGAVGRHSPYKPSYAASHNIIDINIMSVMGNYHPSLLLLHITAHRFGLMSRTLTVRLPALPKKSDFKFLERLEDLLSTSAL